VEEGGGGRGGVGDGNESGAAAREEEEGGGGGGGAGQLQALGQAQGCRRQRVFVSCMLDYKIPQTPKINSVN
jgi:hypothetical protein